jgi:DNA-binding transcriptional LysR family regulator
MHLGQVRYVIALSEELQFTAAARRCGVSQPTLTVGIRKLEHELGQPLFERRPEVRVTEFGQRLLAHLYVINDAHAAIGIIAAEFAKSHSLSDQRKEAVHIAGGL